MTRILMIVERFPPDPGGLARSGARVAGALARQGCEVDVVAWTKRCPPGAMETMSGEEVADAAAGVTLHRIGLYSSQDLSLQHTMNVLQWLHEERSYDAVWGHYLYPTGFMAVMFGRSMGLPTTVSARGNDVDRMMFPPGDFARLTWTLEQASVITAVSDDLANKINVLLGRDARVEVIANAVNPKLFKPGEPCEELREKRGILPGETVLGFCGELRHKKGFPFLLETLVQVRRIQPACLLIIGEARPREQEKLARFAATCPEDGARIRVTGRLANPKDVAQHLRLVDLFLMPSVWDGLPNAVLEAMASERVVLASDAGGIPEAVEHGVSGFIVKRALLNRLGEAAIELLARSEEDRKACGVAARERILERYTPEAEDAALQRVIERLRG